MDTFQAPQTTSGPQAQGRTVHSDTVYSDPTSEKRNKYARAREEHAARSEQRRECLQPVGYSFNPSLMTHLSDLETSDSTRCSSRSPTIPHQHRTQSTIKQQHQQQRATTDYRLLHQAEHDMSEGLDKWLRCQASVLEVHGLNPAMTWLKITSLLSLPYRR